MNTTELAVIQRAIQSIDFALADRGIDSLGEITIKDLERCRKDLVRLIAPFVSLGD